MGKSMSGIGTEDVRALMEAIAALHGCSVMVDLEVCASGPYTKALRVSATAHFTGGSQPASARYCGVERNVRGSDASLTTAIYQTLHLLDAEIGRMYRNNELPF